jgi:hypothetical protein
MEKQLPPNRFAQQRLTVVERKPPTTVRWVHQDPAGGTNDEMPWQADPMEGQAQAPGHLELDDREADREAHSSPDDVIELAVARIAEFAGRRRPKPELPVQDIMQPAEHELAVVPPIEANAHSLADQVERLDGGFESEVRTAVSRDAQGAEGQVDLGFRPGDEPRESSPVYDPGSVDRAHERIVAPGRRAQIRALIPADPSRSQRRSPSQLAISGGAGEALCYHPTGKSREVQA